MPNLKDRVWSWLTKMFIKRSAQALFAEALGQALSGGIEISVAIRLAVAASPNFRLRAQLSEMHMRVREGNSLKTSLCKSWPDADPGLISALEVGEYHGCLPEELFAYARRVVPEAHRALARVNWRRPEAVKFAAALGRLLRDRRMTPALVEDAGRTAAESNPKFMQTIASIVHDLENGCFLGQAIGKHPNHFDAFFCGLVSEAQTREQMQTILELLGKV
ncbi:MAG: type II secretion system F family protein [Planctomycetes bacterium]|nr:type II secretion system F family protein [Planctomycetota bacterium]